jgi:hypothetical protein
MDSQSASGDADGGAVLEHRARHQPAATKATNVTRVGTRRALVRFAGGPPSRPCTAAIIRRYEQ